MKIKLRHISSAIALAFFLFIAFGSTDDKAELRKLVLERGEPFTASEVAGMWKGSHHGDLYRTAVKLELKKDATYTARMYTNGNEMKQNGLSPQSGTYKIHVEEYVYKDDYGNVSSRTYDHYITLYWKSQWGLRKSVYSLHYVIDPKAGVPVEPNPTPVKGYYLYPEKQNFIDQNAKLRGDID